MTACVLVGAGAEVSAPFEIPGGQAFTWATCYTRNAELYKALELHYTPILETFGKERRLPRKYQDAFLYEATNSSFAGLVDSVANSDEGTSVLVELIGDSFLEREAVDEGDLKLSADELSILYDALIKEVGKDSPAIQRLKDYLLKDLPEDAYFGTIEGYFSSLLNPSRRNKSFWKLVNYYWSAFFAVTSQLIEREFSKDKLFQEMGLYRFTLGNLPEVLRAITSDEYVDKVSSKERNYYYQFSDLFDYAITTNYTPFIGSMKVKDDDGPIRLAGSITQFESVPDLCVYDLLEDDVSGNAFLFPFVMTQVPVKPIIGYRQMHEYSRAINAVDRSDAIVVLGYSLCQNDAHIGSMLQTYLRRSSVNKLFYLEYKPAGESSTMRPSDILNRIRLSGDYQRQVSIIHFGEGGEISVDDLRPCLETLLTADMSLAESRVIL